MKIIEFKNVQSGYGKTVVHKNLNFFINKGEIVALVGGSGSGKTTILRLILLLLSPQKGEIYLYGKNTLNLSEREKQELRNRTGVVFQFSALFNSMTVGENIIYPARKIGKYPLDILEDLAYVKLRMVGLEDEVFHKYPEELSGGMKKKVALARALVLDPELLLLDEPTSGLDPVSSEEIETILKTLRDLTGITIFIITHDLHTLNICDRVLVLAEGKIVYDGRPEEIKYLPDPWLQQLFSTKRWKLTISEKRI
jgi:phospholipid/cholesterol/gamma-HCH transport system ATP-binding protein